MCRTYGVLWMTVSPVAAQGSWNYQFLTNWLHTTSISSFSTLVVLQLGNTCGLIMWHLAPFHCEKHSKSSHLGTYLMYNCQHIFIEQSSRGELLRELFPLSILTE